MPVPAALLDIELEPVEHEIDARWTMAYAASLADTSPSYFDTMRPDGVVAHPLFSVCPEWAAIVASRDATTRIGMSRAEVLTGVHATHDTTIHRLMKPGDNVSTRLEMVALTDISPGAKATTRLTTVDAAGRAVATTTQESIYLGVPTAGVDHHDPAPPPPITNTARVGEPEIIAVALPAGAAHTYTECARIWNPIHTDRAVAMAAGLPDIILHGTASLALGVSAVVDHRADHRPELVRRITCRFAAMVRLPSTVVINVWPANTDPNGHQVIPFEVLNTRGDPAVKDGLVVLGEPPHEVVL